MTRWCKSAWNERFARDAATVTVTERSEIASNRPDIRAQLSKRTSPVPSRPEIFAWYSIATRVRARISARAQTLCIHDVRAVPAAVVGYVFARPGRTRTYTWCFIRRNAKTFLTVGCTAPAVVSVIRGNLRSVKLAAVAFALAVLGCAAFKTA